MHSIEIYYSKVYLLVAAKLQVFLTQDLARK